MGNYTLTNIVSTSENPNVAYCNSWLKVDNNADRNLYAQASYVTNFDDLSISLSAGSIDVGSVILKDSSGLEADVVNVGAGSGALRVISQDLESSEDDVTIGDRSGNFATVNSATSSLNVNLTNSNLKFDYENNSTSLDAFGRLRSSNPFTLFDSSHRYSDNGKWSTSTSVGGSAIFSVNEGLVDLTISSSGGSSVSRETTRTFAYQPGKSLLIMNSFVMSPSSNNLTQRVGYYNNNNGFFLELADDVLKFVRISSSIAPKYEVERSLWNYDKLDGTGPSGKILDITKVQILWMDLEWLGSGTVNIGFILDGRFVLCHKFNHANEISSTYIQTACLPIRYEILSSTSQGTTKTLKQICSTVISEGGYELGGTLNSISTPLSSPVTFSVANANIPLISIRLKSIPNRLDSIVIPTKVSSHCIGNGIIYKWTLIRGGITNGGSWVSVGGNSSVEYNITGTSITGGNAVSCGFTSSSNQSSNSIQIDRKDLFKNQLERDSFNSTPFEFILAIQTDTVNNSGSYASMDFEEITI